MKTNDDLSGGNSTVKCYQKCLHLDTLNTNDACLHIMCVMRKGHGLKSFEKSVYLQLSNRVEMIIPEIFI